MTERTITVEDLPAEFERLAAMAISPSHTNIWNSAADMLRAALSSDRQGGRGLSREERDALGKRVFDNAVFDGQSVKLVNWCDAAAVIETLESLGYTLAPAQPPAPDMADISGRSEAGDKPPITAHTEQPDTEGGDAHAESQAGDRARVPGRHVDEGAAVDGDSRALSEHYVPKERAERAEQQLRSLLTDLQGEAGRIIDSGTWETPAAAAGRLEELIRKYAALSSTEQKGAGR